MKYFFATLLLAYSVAALANSSVKPAISHKDKAQSDMINNYYAGPNCKKIEQQLAEIKEDIGALKENQTNASDAGNCMSSEMKQQLAGIRQEIKTLKENQTSSQCGNCLASSEVKQQLAEIKQAIRVLNDSSGSDGLFSEVKQQLAKIKQDIRVLNDSVSDGYGLFSEMKQQLAEIKQEIRALNGNKTGCSGGKVYKNCAEVYQSGNKTSGVYKIDPDGLGEFEVFCDQKTAGGGWTVFQKRQDGSVDFYRGWNDYKQGFGKLNGEFWLGLDKIHRLTVSGSYKLRVDLEDNLGNTRFAEYTSFAVAKETEKYKLSLGSYSGTARDSLVYHRGMAFSTKDRDNDKYSGNCASHCKGAWWYKSCYYSNLNGLYIPGKNDTKGMSWYKWKYYECMKGSEMKIRPKHI